MNSATGSRGSWRVLLPREHGLWGWLGIPMFAALLLAPTVASALAVLAVFSAFALANALRAAGSGPFTARALLCLSVVLTAACAAGSLALTPFPRPLASVHAAVLAAVGVTALFARGRLPRHRALEVSGILAFAFAGALIAVAGGAGERAAAAVLSSMAAWLLLGLWWINRALSGVMPNRTAWKSGLWVATTAAAASAGVAVWCGHSRVGLIPLLYGARIGLARPPATPRDAKRIGLTELAWGLAAAAAAVLLSR